LHDADFHHIDVDMETNTANRNRAIPPISKEVAMFSSSLVSALSEATPSVCQALIATGIKFAVAVENSRGEWFLLHADDQHHASVIARHWVETMNARGASCRRIFADGIAAKPFFTVYEDFPLEEAA
jgi:hypothetical protein